MPAASPARASGRRPDVADFDLALAFAGLRLCTGEMVIAAPIRATLGIGALVLFSSILSFDSAGADIFTFGDHQMLAFADGADGDAAPIRIITSSADDLVFKNALALDLVHREMVVARWSSVITLPLGANGDTTPIRSITGAATGLGLAVGVALDPANGLIYVAESALDRIRVFNRTDDGNVAPVRSLGGPQSLLIHPEGLFLDLVHGELFVTTFPNTASERSVLVFDLDDLGGAGDRDAAPIRRIAGDLTTFGQPRGVAVDLRSDQIVVADRDGALDFFPRAATGDVAPTRRIAGGNTKLGAAQEVAILDDGELLVGIDGAPDSAVVGHAFESAGNANPIREIHGSSTHLTYSIGVASTRARDCSAGKSVDGCLFRNGFDGASACDWSAHQGGAACP